MNDLRLISPNVCYQSQYIDMLNEWKMSGEHLVPWVLGYDTSDFPSMIEMLEGFSKGIGLKGGQVEHSTYWLINTEGKILGVVNIRHRLNDKLLNIGGHIGYGIRLSERRKGYATQILRLALEITRNMGIEKVLVTCDKDNVASAKTIIKNNGILDSEDIFEGKEIQRYWIPIK